MFSLQAILQVHLIINFEREIKDLSYVTALTYFREAWRTVIPVTSTGPWDDKTALLCLILFVSFLFPFLFSIFLTSLQLELRFYFLPILFPVFNAPPWVAMDAEYASDSVFSCSLIFYHSKDQRYFQLLLNQKMIFQSCLRKQK